MGKLVGETDSREEIVVLGGELVMELGGDEVVVEDGEIGAGRVEFGVRSYGDELAVGDGDELVGDVGENDIEREELGVRSHGDELAVGDRNELSRGDGEIDGEREELGKRLGGEELVSCEGEIGDGGVNVAVRLSDETLRERPSDDVLEPSLPEIYRDRDECGNNGQGELNKSGGLLRRDFLGVGRLASAPCIARFGKGKNLDAILNVEFGGVDPLDDLGFGGFNDFGEKISYVYDCENVDEDYISDPEGELGENGGLGRLMMENGFGNLVVSGRDTDARGAVGTRPVSRIEERCTSECSVVRGRQIVLGLRAAYFENVVAPLDHGSLLCDDQSLADMLILCNAPKEIELLKPDPLQRPWTPPEGYICLY